METELTPCFAPCGPNPALSSCHDNLPGVCFTLLEISLYNQSQRRPDEGRIKRVSDPKLIEKRERESALLNYPTTDLNTYIRGHLHANTKNNK